MALILNGTDGVSDVDGTAATPAFRGSDANTGIFFPAADVIAFAEGGVEAARLTSDGNLLIGATSQTYSSPTFGYKLGIQSGVSQTYISIAKSGQSLDSGGMVIGIDATGGSVQVLENQPFRFFTNSLHDLVKSSKVANVIPSNDGLVTRARNSIGIAPIESPITILAFARRTP